MRVLHVPFRVLSLYLPTGDPTTYLTYTLQTILTILAKATRHEDVLPAVGRARTGRGLTSLRCDHGSRHWQQ
jgi:hypothetical protein